MGSTIASGSIGVLPPESPFIASGIYDNSEYPTLDTVYTVPANQTLYIQGMSFSSTSSGAQPIVKIDSTQVFITVVAVDSTTAFAGNPVFSVEAGQVLKTVAGSGGETYFWNFWGYLL